MCLLFSLSGSFLQADCLELKNENIHRDEGLLFSTLEEKRMPLCSRHPKQGMLKSQPGGKQGRHVVLKRRLGWELAGVGRRS